ncbi:MAG: hypothetical protein GXP38_01270 [Chloroflexi bacterium]|nr:hypothetical protein [Chloroflexota bacterium]
MLLILGLDGADWNILSPWIEQGALPHLAALRERSAWGPLHSTLRPESSIAWSTFATGLLPGHHGIFSFSRQQPDSYSYGLNNALSVRAPTFWQWAAAAQKRIALLNVPMTYPPQPLPHGAVIAGMLTPSLRSPFTQPPSLREQLLAAVSDYTINVDRSGLSLEAFIRQTIRAIRARGKAARWLLAQQAWDAAVIVFTATDRLQHYTLHLLSPQHPHYEEEQARKLVPLLLTAYQTIDEIIGQLVADAGPEATIILLSDHGFAPCARLFYPNVWLEEQGWLQRTARPLHTPSLWQLLRTHPQLRKIKQQIPFLRDWQRQPQPGNQLSAIDWSQTRAVYTPTSGIRLNIRGREPQGILSQEQAEKLSETIIQALRELRDPATGVSPIVATYHRADIYAGPYLDSAPDIIIEPRRSDPNPANNTAIAFGFAPSSFSTSGEITGNHTFSGILLAAGPGIEPRHLTRSRLLDLAPTILHTLGIAAPETMDGEVLPLWSHPDAIETTLPRNSPPSPSHSPFAPELSSADQQAIEERLRALGYL